MSDKSPKVIPPFAAQPANSGGRVGDTDWMCPDVVCGNVNFARRNSCNRCGKERVDLKSKKKLGTEIGKSAADKSRGLFSADDWQCNKCANVNWARRQTCNVCNAPKFGEQVEARTGYGGGYNERGTVEYRPKRDSDDDEYDEFGRRKKRKLKDCGSTQDKVTATSRPRTLIMENRVSSTNELKYRFSGKTRDENFEVTYTLQERVTAAAWALAYQNCRLSSEKFQNAFDKPAPDFKTIFAWRQRLLYNGCLVDKHFYVDEDPTLRTSQSSNKNDEDFISINPGSHNSANAHPGRFNRRKRLRYYKNIPPRDTTDSSTSESEELPRKSNRNSLPMLKKVIVLSEEKHKIKPLSNEPIILSDASPEDGEKFPVAASVNSLNSCKNVKDNHEEYTIEDNNIAFTPALTVVRADLANFSKSPVRVEIPESQFSEDIYFHDDVLLAAKANKVEIKHVAPEAGQFLMPNVPKEKKTPPKPIDPLLNVLEDIVSESDRYSSDGNASETDSYEKMYGKDETVKKSSPVALEPYIAPKEIPKYQPSHTDFINLPLPKFAHKEKVKILNDESCNNSSSAQQRCTKNMSVAMRRIYESMTSSGNSAERIDELVLEYIPTKINPAMAKRNHQFFTDDNVDDVILECTAQPLLLSKMPSPKKATISPQKPDIFDIIKKKESPKKPVFKLPMFEDYLPEEDDLYKDSSSDGGSDRTMLRTPPAAPNIGPMVTETAQEPQRVQDHMTENMTTITKVMCQSMDTESPATVFVTKSPPPIVTQVPDFVDDAPVIFSEPPPPVAVNKSIVVSNTPAVTKYIPASAKPCVSPTKPNYAVTKPCTSPTKPMYAVTKPPVTVTKPTFAVTKHPVAVTKSPIVVSNSSVAITKPPEVFTEVPVTVSKPPDTYNKSSDSYNKSPDAYNKSPNAYNKSSDSYNKSPDVYNKSSNVYSKSAEAYNKSADAYNKSSDSYNKSPDAYNKSSNAYNKSPGAYNKSTDTYNKSPGVCRKSPDAYNKSPDTYNKSPDACNKSADTYNKSPGVYHKSPDAYTKSPDTYNKSPGACNKSPDTCNKSPDTYNKLAEAHTELPDTYNKSPDKSLEAPAKSPDTCIKSADTHNKSPGVYNKSPDTCNKSPDVCNRPAAIDNPPPIFSLPQIDFSKPPPQIVQTETPILSSSICNFNFANINAIDLIRALQNIQNLSTTASPEVIPEVEEKQTETVEEGDLQIVEEKQREVIDCDVEEVVKKPASIPFLSDMFDPGSPVHEDTAPKDPEVVADFNFEVPSDNYLELPSEKPIVGSFKSFAFAPKPIMLNRLKKINEQKLGKTQSDEAKNDDKKGAKRKKRSRADDEDEEPTEAPRPDEVEEPEDPAPAVAAPEEEDEESGEEGDLSKYDLWGSEDEDGGEKDQSKSPPPAANNNPVEKANDSPRNKTKSPPSKNSADKRRRKSESGSPSSRSSSSSSSSSDSSSGRAPRNRYDDFDLNSEHSPPSPPGRKERGRSDRTIDPKHPRRPHRSSRHSATTTSAINNRSSSSHKVDSGRRHRAHRHRR